MKKLGVLIVILLAFGVIFFAIKQNPVPQTQNNSEEEAVRTVVESFGQTLKNVPLLAPTSTLIASIEQQYGPFVSQDILTFWTANPQEAPGRITSSPWPDGLEIFKIEKDAEGAYLIQAHILEATSSGPVPSSNLMALKLRNKDGRWIITGITRTGQ